MSIVLVAMLSGCAQPDLPTEPAPKPLPVSPSADPDPSPAAVIVRALALDLVDTDGEILTSVSYYDPVARVVDGLTQATGTAPSVSEYADDSGRGPGVSYKWDGLKVLDIEQPAVMPETPEWSVVVTGATTGHLSVSTADMVAVGLSRAEVDALVPGALGVPAEGSEETYAFGEAEVTRVGVSTGSGDMVSHRVLFALKGSPLAVVEIVAPDPVGGH